MSAWASGNLAQKLKQQKKAAVAPDAKESPAPSGDRAGPPAPPVKPAPAPAPAPASAEPEAEAPRGKPSAGASSGSPPRTAPPAPPPPAPLVAAAEPAEPAEAPARVSAGPVVFTDTLATLLRTEFSFCGQVKTAPLAPAPVEEARPPQQPPAAAPRPIHAVVAEEAVDVSRIKPVHHHHHHHHHHLNVQQPLAHPQPQPTFQGAPVSQSHHHKQYQSYSKHQHQHNRYAQRGMSGHSHRDSFRSSGYMNTYAAPYGLRMYDGYPAMGMGMGMYGGMGEYDAGDYGSFPLQGRPPYYPVQQNNQPGSYNSPHQLLHHNHQQQHHQQPPHQYRQQKQ